MYQTSGNAVRVLRWTAASRCNSVIKESLQHRLDSQRSLPAGSLAVVHGFVTLR
jgi:hypothetical protein